MGNRSKTMPGLKKINKTWHIDKRIMGHRICMSTYTGNYKEAEQIYLAKVNEIRSARLLGARPKRTFNQAIVHYIKNHEKKSLTNDEIMLNKISDFIGDKLLTEIHMGSLQELIINKQKQGLKTSTINNYLQIIRHVLNLAASEWIDEHGLTWLENAPKIKFIKNKNIREPYPLSWEEQDKLFGLLPNHLQSMALFKVNTGTREQEVCNLRWEWEIKLKDVESSVFIVPKEFVKNGEDRVIVLNNVAKKIVNEQRGKNTEFVFAYKGQQIKSMNNTAWRNARLKANLEKVRVHDLKHTYGRRLRAAGVSMEDRQDLLGHKNSKITSHYSVGEINDLIQASNKILENNSRKKPSLTLLKVNN
jgi:integrase